MLNISPELVEHLIDKSGCSEVFEVHHLRGERVDNRGRAVDVSFTVLDRGPWHAERYQVEVEDSLGRVATGRPNPDLYVAISNVDWEELDR